MSPTYVAIIQQGMVLDQRVIAVGIDQQELQKASKAEAAKLNSQETGFAEEYEAVVLKVPSV